MRGEFAYTAHLTAGSATPIITGYPLCRFTGLSQQYSLIFEWQVFKQ
jgi:hypothetical protein